MKTIIVTILCGTAALVQARAADKDPHACSTQAAKGAYSQTLSGKATGIGDVAGVGTVFLDGAGKFSGNVTGTATVGGISITESSRTTGTFVLNSDCSGTFTLHFVDLSLDFAGVLVVMNDGNDAAAVITSPSTAQLTGALHRQ